MITELKKGKINHLNFIVTIPQKIVDIYAKVDITDEENEQIELFYYSLTLHAEGRARVAAFDLIK